MNYAMVGSSFTILSETPCADPHAGCCGDWGLDTPGYPIMPALLVSHPYPIRLFHRNDYNQPKNYSPYLQYWVHCTSRSTQDARA